MWMWILIRTIKNSQPPKEIFDATNKQCMLIVKIHLRTKNSKRISMLTERIMLKRKKSTTTKLNIKTNQQKIDFGFENFFMVNKHKKNIGFC